MAVLGFVQVYVLRETEREETGWQNQVQLLHPAKGCFPLCASCEIALHLTTRLHST
ncbi:hypothetical protein D3C81_1943120 [compost metagenome]